MAFIEQDGKDCIVAVATLTRRVKDCDPLKLANTLWDKPGEKYSRDEMEKWGFYLK